ncbi:hypothetical protein QR685DRAFT_544042 [Neurospora intermedia]|uniref:Homing endonuclease LAGLIDADG domain-containing protein n=1 Tax=Neurospora intermedia TaxID=5142 RepID=A0ABR3DCC0_NEUIN
MPFYYLLTPKKAELIGAIRNKPDDPIHYSNTDIFRKLGIGKTAGYRVIKNADSPRGMRTFYSLFVKTRGRLKKLLEEHITIFIDFIGKNSFDGRTILYKGLLNIISIKLLYTISRRTI